VEQRAGAVGVIRRQEREDPVEAFRGPRDVQRHRALAGQHQRSTRRFLELAEVLSARRAAQLQRLSVVVGEQFGMVGDPFDRESLDPPGGQDMLVHPGEPRDLTVGDVPDQRVREGVFHVTLHRRDS
jgi:hypothetical protein